MDNPFAQNDRCHAWGPGSFEMALPLIEATSIRPGMVVLEVGGGSGDIAATLAKHWNVTVYTLEPWFGGEAIHRVAKAAGVGERVIALKETAQKMEFAEAFFDAVISIGSFEMIGDERPQALAQMVRVAKPGARVGIAEPMCLPVAIPPEVAELDRRRFPDKPGYERCFRSVEWNARLFEQAGLSVVERSYFPDARRWWTEFAGRVSPLERELILCDGGRWASLGMVVGEKPR